MELLPKEIQEYILSLAVWQQIRERRKLFGPLHKELFDYVTLKNIWGRNGIRVVAPPFYEWNLVHGNYTLTEMIRVPKEDLFIYGYFWSRTKKDRVLLGFKYQEVIELVLRDYS